MVDKTGDAIALWQQMVGEMQKGFAAFAKQGLGSLPPGRQASDRSAFASGAQKHMADLMESYFNNMNLPSRGQLKDMSERLQAIELELSEIKALLLRMVEAAAIKETAAPKEVTVPTEAAVPPETAAPTETAALAEAVAPTEAAAPNEAAAPKEEAAAPEETAAPKEAAAAPKVAAPRAQRTRSRRPAASGTEGIEGAKDAG
ncbi:hypothetical protein BRAS3843_1790004 [Bradyrhizobium sp. STM 3843]|uniref:hypothetical protein n=1 Tax=Bradyrhizobium sp. STM 3843 TaxID=551947 RepID=UPI00024071C8|nr:hypothetical protein [Bradyrhizobium sp. STM 3843]CCE06688.1 hypothetical protein BRAS3843_1790004 [Bradyrhizobium sp. STM 3843]